MNKKTIDEVAAYVDEEGIGYAITDGWSASSIEDEDLAFYWRVAEEAIEEIERRLEDG